MKSLLIILVFVLGTCAKKWPRITLYSKPNQLGYTKCYPESASDLSLDNFDDTTSSVVQTGV
ncbi:hypothetical protein E2C01_020818 [Portunus trituberculatus]|uniref:Uncharacterized protein n=1 Tax=Portunus trituberculatus TaxID=210409 RepID=A0A5B7E341_PORTR|nr:hypothetical protein [Portunus trituberculatus]